MAINLKNYKGNTFSKETKSSTSSKKSTSILDFLNQDIELFNSYFNNKIKQSFYSNLETLLTAGLDIQNALSLIEEGQKKKATKAIIHELQQEVVNGQALSEAMQSVGRFTNYEIQSVRIGEETGRLNIVLAELADFFEKSLKYRRQLLGALSYPLFVSSFALGVVYFLLRYLVPMFSGIYGRFDKELPAITQKIVTISEWLQSYSYLVFLAIFGLVIFLYWQRTKIWFRKWSAKVLLRMPIFGSIIKQIYLARFCQSMFLLLSAKVPLLKAVALVRQMIAFYPIEQALEQSEQGIIQGELLSTMLKQSKFFPNQLLALLAVGEEASRLEQMFSKLAKQYNEAVDQQTEVVGRLIEPVLIIGLGLLVGIILVAMYMPLFQLSTNV